MPEPILTPPNQVIQTVQSDGQNGSMNSLQMIQSTSSAVVPQLSSQNSPESPHTPSQTGPNALSSTQAMSLTLGDRLNISENLVQSSQTITPAVVAHFPCQNSPGTVRTQMTPNASALSMNLVSAGGQNSPVSSTQAVQTTSSVVFARIQSQNHPESSRTSPPQITNNTLPSTEASSSAPDANINQNIAMQVSHSTALQDITSVINTQTQLNLVSTNFQCDSNATNSNDYSFDGDDVRFKFFHYLEFCFDNEFLCVFYRK